VEIDFIVALQRRQHRCHIPADAGAAPCVAQWACVDNDVEPISRY
jgi:hypothetical protein